MTKNIYDETIKDFGEEWSLYQYSENDEENKFIFDQYFDIFPWDHKNLPEFTCLDLGCGTGRWSKILSTKVKSITLLDPSHKALNIAKKNLEGKSNVTFINKKFDDVILEDQSFDFIFSLGVLHHMDNISLQLKKINKILKKDGLTLIYLYYRFDNKSLIFKSIWKISDFLRTIICNLPFKLKSLICNLIATIVYLPLSYLYKFLKLIKINVRSLPLSFYADKSFYIMRTDALDRFGTKVENRFLKTEIEKLLLENGFKDIVFSPKEPFWHVIAKKK